ncbi:MAG TPA: hypothetical protein VGB24_08110 [Longimicrobium sp.]|jgi:hypothetical protein|uniref:hypothetical protein n=1 Tax=Longimicrobium sp. TaxID=2029185 RepID=UPI002ED79691
MSNASKYQVVITMQQATADMLNQNGFLLYGFKAVSGPPSGKPVVWFATSDYGLNTKVQWSEFYKVFTSRNTDVDFDTQISVDNDYPASLSDVLTVDSPTGTGTVADGGPEDAISVVNATSSPFSCGISQLQSDGNYAPLAVFPLFGNSEDEMVPVEKVFLMFASQTVDTGTVIEKSFSAGILIDLTDAPQDASGALTRTVSFDISTSWSDGHATWGTVLPPNTDLVPLLISGQVPASV